ncbi:Kinesin-like protein kin-7f [Thalictrum thalictroides]|uniref:Kinesin-like protein n=1 Tax=Thalictrum thalictroides TaxID=46969 RepID=A0A7J6WLL4_THATH|nr:Kinesin-like protein kin-7f [Thalictrum thalictroides]
MGEIGGVKVEEEEETMGWEPTTPIASARQEEKILVTVRLRPLNDKEIEKNDVSDWECINDNTVIYRNSLAERYNYPTAYTFDRVFQGYCTTKQVYEEAAKGVALSVVSGINSSIFAYGQTSSGKTYTMVGITEYTVADIFDYIQRHEERAFVMKFSAMEIYNEAVRDLLSGDNSPLRVLDDPEKGTIVEKLTEETLRDWNHLQQLLSICEAQRQVGETLLNEASSRSHQILKLTIESSAREFLGKDNSSTLAATVNFVDLAGSERASQALSAGTRLKEGCHINRSLLTLGTVIRKLSKGRNGHVPYRDSKLTRILQPSLGGNARTAIICTMSPARSHVEQTRNTLLFASCAKEVATNAHVNVVMSDKALVKHLQKELARLESELRGPVPTPATSSSAALLREKDRQIEKMQKEIKELTWQRNLAQSRLEDLLKVVGDDKSSRNGPKSCPPNTWVDDNSVSELSGTDFHQGWKECTGHTEEDLEYLCKEVRCIEMEESSTNKDVEFHASLSAESDGTGNEDATDRESVESPQRGDAMHFNQDSTYGALEQKLQDVQKTIDGLVNPYPEESYSSPVMSDLLTSRSLHLSRSQSCRETLKKSTSPWSQEVDQNVNTPPNGFEKDFPGRPNGLRKKLFALKYDADNERLPVDDSHSEQSASVDELKGENGKASVEEDVTSISTFVTGLKEMAKLQYEKQFTGQGQEIGLEVSEPEKCSRDIGLDPMQDTPESPLSWTIKFQRQRTAIIELWHTCNVSLVHRTYFFLLFNGEPTDNIYMEVELRRLSFLKDAFTQGLPGNVAVEDIHAMTPASSIRALRRERVMLSRRMQRRLSVKERENLYQKWGIGLDTKQRRLQLVQCLWTNTEDMDHIMDSADVIAKLVGLLKPGQVLKEMFGLSFAPTSQRSFSWKHSLSSLILHIYYGEPSKNVETNGR